MQKHFLRGLFIKLFGGLSFAFVYTYYYTYGGDTKAYYFSAQNLTQFFFSDPNLFFRMFFLNKADGLTNFEYSQLFRFGLDTPEFFIIKITTLVNIIGLNSYFGTSILFAVLSFIGIWIFYKSFVKVYPKLKNQFAIPFLYFPSVFFWGSGISKDTIVIGFMGLTFYFFLKLSNKFNLVQLILAFTTATVIFQIKSYVILSIAPVLLVYFFLRRREQIKNKVIKVIIAPIVLIVGLIAGIVGINVLGALNPKYSVENVISTSQQMQSWHYVKGENTSDNHGRGSSYTLGEYDPTILGVLSIAPSAINVSLFRPYFWEVKNAGMFAAAIESSAMLLFTIFVFFKLNPATFFKGVLKNDLAFLCISFSLLFLFFVGFSSYNFGALMRYKIPAIPFYISGIIIILYNSSKGKSIDQTGFKGA